MLEKLTPEQEAMIPEFRDWGLRVGLSTQRTDRAKAEKALVAHYEASGLNAPKNILWFDSPYASVIASFKDNVRTNVRANVRTNVGTNVWTNVGANVWTNVRANVWTNVRANVGTNVGANVWTNVGTNVGTNVWTNVRANVWDNVGAHWDAPQSAWYMAWDRYGLSLPKSALTHIAVTEHVWWYYPGKEIVYASDRPKVLRRNQQGRLHCENGRAVEFADGTGFCSWNGTTLPDKWVLEKDSINPTEILKERDVEVRAAGAACVGWPRMLTELDYKIIDSDPEPSHGELIELQLDGLPEPGRFLRAECPRNGTICEGVPNDIETVLAAQAWRVGLAPDEFSYPTVRT